MRSLLGIKQETRRSTRNENDSRNSIVTKKCSESAQTVSTLIPTQMNERGRHDVSEMPGMLLERNSDELRSSLPT